MTPDITATLADHIAGSADRALPDEVLHKARHHVIDTLAACVSGAHLPAGRMAAAYTIGLRGAGPATLIGDGRSGRADDIAMANAMMAHADETDDSHAASITHPGCAVIPAALAACERSGAGGGVFLRAVICGYDVCARIAMALGGEAFFATHRSSHAYGGLFGAVAAASVAAGLDVPQCRVVLSYAAQQASGITSWRRDPDHIEKAFDFAGMPARAALASVMMVQAGFSGVVDALDGAPGFLAACLAPDPEACVAELGMRFEIMHTTIKRWCVGSPIQAPLDATETLMATHVFGHADVRNIDVEVAVEASRVVDRKRMPSVNLQHQVALLIVDRGLSFESSHAPERMLDPDVRALAERINLLPSEELSALQPSRQARVTITLRDGRVLHRHASDVKGTPAMPMSDAEIDAKALGLMAPVLEHAPAREALAALWRLGSGADADMRQIARLLCPKHLRGSPT